MATCEVCGNEYLRAFEVHMAGQTHTFDSFECAIHRLAPTCGNCSVRVIGHGIEAGTEVFCCAHCATVAGHTDARDHLTS